MSALSLSACTPPHMYMYKKAVEKGQAAQVEVYVSIRERDVSAYVEKGQANLSRVVNKYDFGCKDIC